MEKKHMKLFSLGRGVRKILHVRALSLGHCVFSLVVLWIFTHHYFCLKWASLKQVILSTFSRRRYPVADTAGNDKGMELPSRSWNFVRQWFRKNWQ
jgi:hypothetical protein